MRDARLCTLWSAMVNSDGFKVVAICSLVEVIKCFGCLGVRQHQIRNWISSFNVREYVVN